MSEKSISYQKDGFYCVNTYTGIYVGVRSKDV